MCHFSYLPETPACSHFSKVRNTGSPGYEDVKYERGRNSVWKKKIIKNEAKEKVG